ncbi:MAG TPA: plastocyanin/azurin family copper-binding protein [Longimicrobiaceae bacterium]
MRATSHITRGACVALLCALLGAVAAVAPAAAQQRSATSSQAAAEDRYYRLITIPIPEGVVLEVGGMTNLPGGQLGIATRRGDVWIVDDPYMEAGTQPHFSRFARGLHEPLGLAYRDGALYTAQRGELTRLVDRDGDGRADRYETVYSWPLSGNYHEYSYGPVFTPDGNMLVTLNLAWIGYGASLAKWRGWAIEITPDGQMTPIATGLRSPAGYGYNLDGELFYAENQGDWVGSGGITHLERGDFAGNPAGLIWTNEPESPLRLRPEDVPDTGEPEYVVAQRVPGLKPPAVWFPHTVLGISTSDILVDSTGGRFGPFAGQLFVGDQGHSKIMRVFLEKVDGVYQGVVFPFREGFSSGVLRMIWGTDASMFVGMTNRGWASTGRAPFGLQRLVWTGEMPFEAQKVEARPDGFEITFTRPVDPASAADPTSYAIQSFTYHYHHTYGSPPIDQQVHPVTAVEVSEDGLRARLQVEGLRQGYAHEIRMSGVRSAEGEPLLHDTGYYTLNRIPAGERMRTTSTSERPTVAAAASRNESGGGGSVAGAVATGAKRQTTIPVGWNGSVDRTVTIRTVPGMRFDLAEVTVQPGERIRLVLENPDDMLHNLLVVAPGAADRVVEAAMNLGLSGQTQHYVPDSQDVLFHTALLQPGTQEAIYFQAPSEPGEYPYVCTFPGHGITMRGVLRVEE